MGIAGATIDEPIWGSLLSDRKPLLTMRDPYGLLTV